MRLLSSEGAGRASDPSTTSGTTPGASRGEARLAASHGSAARFLWLVAAAAVVAALSASPRAAERATPPAGSRAAIAMVPVAPATVPAAPVAGVDALNPPRELWAEAPELVVLMSVMRYHLDTGVEYTATAEVLTDEEADGLVADLTEALAVLTDGRFTGFAAVHREAAPAGSTSRIVRPGRIVVGRYAGIRQLRNTIGYGGRVPGRDGGITAGAVMLDCDYDRTAGDRRLLRIHELGHALGYDHVDAYPSIMNARIGTEPTDFDRQAARRAFWPAAAGD